MCGVDGQGGSEGRAVKACAVALRFAFYGAQPNARSLQIGLENIMASESKIRDADFAVETAALSRAQILQQAGTSVLATANASAQGVLRLLQQ